GGGTGIGHGHPLHLRLRRGASRGRVRRRAPHDRQPRPAHLLEADGTRGALMQLPRFLRYLAPNLVTFASLTFGMSSIVASFEHRFVDAAWFVMFSVLTDKLDGFVARLVKGTSEFGVQLDSFADFLNFGIAPATPCYVS